ncbi:MAG: metal ABC transporter permease, partial [Planctomycetaceae bacterium]|nr:metal ABC transporter permease [Planctomycetaceae bacterium]
MLHEFLQLLSDWSSLDTAIAASAALTAMSCALPGAWLVLRKHSMMGDALSHSALPGVVMAFLFAVWLKSAGWITAAQHDLVLHGCLFLGAVGVGVATAWLTEWVQRWGRLESGASLGVVFTSVFALGLLLLRLKADDVHIDVDCVLFGILETAALNTVTGTSIPEPLLVNGVIFAVNLLLNMLFFKELRISAFDPGLATTLGIPARGIHYGLMAVTAMTVVAAFTTVGSILVIGLLIIPAATALLLSERLQNVLLLSVVIAGVSAVLGHAFTLTLPRMIFSRLGYPMIEDAGTAGMMSVTAGGLFVAALVFSPRQGLVSRLVHRLRLGVKIAGDDVLGLLYRYEERTAFPPPEISLPELVAKQNGVNAWLVKLSIRRLLRRGLLTDAGSGEIHLTGRGRESAQSLVRAHRLWEAYMAKNFDLPDDHLHETAHRVEHVLDDALQARLERELDAPTMDPHGK